MGSRVCKDMPAQVQVRHRCPCLNKTICGEEEALAVDLAQQGKFTSQYLLKKTGPQNNKKKKGIRN